MTLPSAEDQTPLMRQYLELKEKAGDAFLLFRMGDFYELFGDDAIEAARILEITLTTRDRNKANPVPMAGVPHHSAQIYIQRLLRAGKKVAIGEQMEDPSLVKGKSIVRREIVRTFTPAVQFDSESPEANFLACIVPTEQCQWVMVCLDASTGEILAGDPQPMESLREEIADFPIRHLLSLTSNPIHEELRSRGSILTEVLPSNYLSGSQARSLLQAQYEAENLEIWLSSEAAILALGVTLTYVLRSQNQEKLCHLKPPAPLRKPKALVLGPRTAQHLDLITAADETPGLFQLINRTRSVLGARLLRRWLLAPLSESREISPRQEAVRELGSAEAKLADQISKELSKVYDLERISARIGTGLANPRDTLALGQSLHVLPALSSLLRGARSQTLVDLGKTFESVASTLNPLSQRILKTQREDAPISSKDGDVFRAGTHSDLDHLLAMHENGQKWLIELEAQEREKTGIPSLKIRYNRVFGYYIEITQAHLKNAPPHYQRKQTMVGAERFFTEELKKFEDEILNASSRRKALEQRLFEDLLSTARELTTVIMQAAQALAELDALTALARLSQERGWVFPQIDDSLDLEIRDGRHPLVDGASRGEFVPNDLSLSPETRMSLIITGPNMGGKSTLMRQTALIVILGQMGSPVPATSARWGSVSSIYTRIGAHDAIARGQSTFMVEMSELAHILHHADHRSLTILDEIGRGTSTYDGMSVAWATLEWICEKIRARTLFATHYHELTRLEGSLPGLANAHMAVEGNRGNPGGDLRFLYLLREGPTNESFGIHVARIAGLPKPVIKRAWEVLDNLEKQRHPHAHHSLEESRKNYTVNQLNLFDPPQTDPAQRKLLNELEGVNIDEMTPVQALNFVVKLQEISRESSSGSV